MLKVFVLVFQCDAPSCFQLCTVFQSRDTETICLPPNPNIPIVQNPLCWFHTHPFIMTCVRPLHQLISAYSRVVVRPFEILWSVWFPHGPRTTLSPSVSFHTSFFSNRRADWLSWWHWYERWLTIYIYVYFFSVMAKTTSRICGIEAFPISVPKTTVVDSGVKIPQKWHLNCGTSHH